MQNVMRDNIGKVLERGDKLADIEDKSGGRCRPSAPGQALALILPALVFCIQCSVCLSDLCSGLIFTLAAPCHGSYRTEVVNMQAMAFRRGAERVQRRMWWQHTKACP